MQHCAFQTQVFTCPDCKVSPRTVTVSIWLCFVNSTLNPIIYAVFNENYRSALKTFFGMK